jgi:hypothetical protein
VGGASLAEMQAMTIAGLNQNSVLKALLRFSGVDMKKLAVSVKLAFTVKDVVKAVELLSVLGPVTLQLLKA